MELPDHLTTVLGLGGGLAGILVVIIELMINQGCRCARSIARQAYRMRRQEHRDTIRVLERMAAALEKRDSEADP